jgi:tetratricopeptide (TPR) repeat protein
MVDFSTLAGQGTRRITSIRRIILVICSLILVVFIGGSIYDAKLTANDTATSLYIIGTELMDTGAYVDAVDVLQKASALNPKDPYIFYDLGDAAYLAGNETLATRAWDQALKLNPELGKIRNGAALVRPKEPRIRSARQKQLLDSAISQWDRAWRIFETKETKAHAHDGVLPSRP